MDKYALVMVFQIVTPIKVKFVAHKMEHFVSLKIIKPAIKIKDLYVIILKILQVALLNTLMYNSA